MMTTHANSQYKMISPRRALPRLAGPWPVTLSTVSDFIFHFK